MSAVARPGPQPITDVPLTVAEAVGLAGDVTPTGDLAHVMLTRDGKTHDINLLALYDKGDTAQNVLIKKVMSSMCRIAARRTEASLRLPHTGQREAEIGERCVRRGRGADQTYQREDPPSEG